MLFGVRQDLAARRVGKDLILYDSINRSVHVLNMTAAEIFRLCDGTHTPKDIAEALLELFDRAEYAQVYSDVKQTLDMLRSRNLIFPKKDGGSPDQKWRYQSK